MKSLVWFGNNLRIKDNLPLYNACQGDSVFGVYCIDPRWQQKGDFGFKKMGVHRAHFLLETLADLKESLKSLNISLLIYHGRPEAIIPEIIGKYEPDRILLQTEWTRDETLVIRDVRSRVGNKVLWESYYDQFLFHPDDIPYQDIHDIPHVFTPFRKKCEKEVQLRPSLPAPAPMPAANLLDNSTPIPTLEELGYPEYQTEPRTAFPFKGGESRAWARIQDYFWDSRKLALYKKTRNGLVGRDYSSKLSAWLANGSISARSVYWEVRKFEKEIVKNQDTYWLIFELIWRDFFKYISLKHGSSIFGKEGISGANSRWEIKKDILKQWVSGSTTEPFINANMKELALSGWMSNRGRQNVASYWSKELGQDWRYGAAYFESMLIDYDVHSNWGNWMYNSGLGNDPRNRKFNIGNQAERYDPSGEYRRLWLQPSLFGSELPTPGKPQKE